MKNFTVIGKNREIKNYTDSKRKPYFEDVKNKVFTKFFKGLNGLNYSERILENTISSLNSQREVLQYKRSGLKRNFFRGSL